MIAAVHPIKRSAQGRSSTMLPRLVFGRGWFKLIDWQYRPTRSLRWSAFLWFWEDRRLSGNYSSVNSLALVAAANAKRQVVHPQIWEPGDIIFSGTGGSIHRLSLRSGRGSQLSALSSAKIRKSVQTCAFPLEPNCQSVPVRKILQL
jgi:hypothetical protein